MDFADDMKWPFAHPLFATQMLNVIERFVNLQGWKFGRIDGNTNVAARQRLVDTFNQDDSYFGLLCTTRTGGVGLNLTGANRIILYDPDWVRARNSNNIIVMFALIILLARFICFDCSFHFIHQNPSTDA